MIIPKFFVFANKPYANVVLFVIAIVLAAVTAVFTILIYTTPTEGNQPTSNGGEATSAGNATPTVEDDQPAPTVGEAPFVRVELYQFELDEDHRDDGYHYHETSYSTQDYGSAIITDVNFWSGCDVFNHSWKISPRVMDNGQWGILLWGGVCNKVSMSVFFIKNKALDGNIGYWKMPDLESNRYKRFEKL